MAGFALEHRKLQETNPLDLESTAPLARAHLSKLALVAPLNDENTFKKSTQDSQACAELPNVLIFKTLSCHFRGVAQFSKTPFRAPV